MTIWRRAGLLWQFAAVSLVVIVSLGVALGALLGHIVESNALQEAAEEATQTVSLRVLQHLSPEDFRSPMQGQRYADFERFVEQNVVSGRTARIKLWGKDGTVIFSNSPSQVGQRFPIKTELATALNGGLATEVSDLQAVENSDERQYRRLLEVYAPIIFPGSSDVAGAFEIYQFYEPFARVIRNAQGDVFVSLAVGLLIFYAALFAIVKRGHDTIDRQQEHLTALYRTQAGLAIEKAGLLAIVEERADALQEAYASTLEALSSALDLRDGGTESHSRRAGERTRLLAQALGLSPEEQDDMFIGALLHDLGKIGVPDAILRKPGPLSPEEWVLMREHPRLGYDMLASTPFLAKAAPIVLHHHESWAGNGYPDGLRGEEIPLSARIFAVVDAYDAITADRPYRKGRTHGEAVDEIVRCSGLQFDPQIVSAFLRTCDQFATPLAPQSALSGPSRSNGVGERIFLSLDSRARRAG